MILLLEDTPERRWAFIARFKSHGLKYRCETSAEDFLDELRVHADEAKVVFLDHDLTNRHYCGGCDDECGCEAVRLIAARPDLCARLKGALFVVHSLNDTKPQAMVRALEAAGLRAIMGKFCWESDEAFDKIMRLAKPIDQPARAEGAERWTS